MTRWPLMTGHETMAFCSAMLAEVRRVDTVSLAGGELARVKYATPLHSTFVHLREDGLVEIEDRFYPIAGGVRVAFKRRRMAPEVARARMRRDAGNRLEATFRDHEELARHGAAKLRRNLNRRRSAESRARALEEAALLDRVAAAAAARAREWAGK